MNSYNTPEGGKRIDGLDEYVFPNEYRGTADTAVGQNLDSMIM